MTKKIVDTLKPNPQPQESTPLTTTFEYMDPNKPTIRREIVEIDTGRTISVEEIPRVEKNKL